MRVFFVLFTALSMYGSPVQALTIICEISSQGDQGNFGAGFMRKSTVDDFSPPKQAHILDLKRKTATYKGPDFKANLDVLTAKRIRWKYAETFENKEKTIKHTVAFNYLYLRGNYKIVTSVDFGPAYMKIVSTRGNCKEQ